MSTTLRGSRHDPPEIPTGTIRLRPLPEIDEAEGASAVLTNAIPMLGSLGSIALVATMGGGSTGRSYLAVGLFAFTTVAFIVVQVERQRKQHTRQVTGTRTEYLRYLSGVRKMVRESAEQQRRALTWQHPEPSALPALAAERSRVWEHTAVDSSSFLRVRYGLGHQSLSTELIAPDNAGSGRVDPAAAAALNRLLVVHRDQANLPASVDLRAFEVIEVCGPEQAARSLARAIVCAATAFHAPGQLLVAVLASETRLIHWDWVKWLPHAQSTQHDAIGPIRMVTTSLTDLAAVLPPGLADRPQFGRGDRPAAPHLLLVNDGAPQPPGDAAAPPPGRHGVTVLDLPSRWRRPSSASRLRLELDGHPTLPVVTSAAAGGLGKVPLRALRVDAAEVRGVADQCDMATAEAFARRLPRVNTAESGRTHGAEDAQTTGPVDLLELLGQGDVHELHPASAWRARPARDRLRVPIGRDGGGSPVHLDLKESAQQGMGPHGLVVGATGSGKSEFLRSLVLGLALTHSPEDLNVVLIDFKGGATFAGMSGMPHVSAVITNLARELALVDRMQDALSGELVRRQELLRGAGNYASTRDYERARRAGERLEPMPALLLVVDEFSELLSAKPELIDLFMTVGRLGRSLGLHLLLASQRLEEGRLRGLESHLSYRVALRTFSAQESRSVLGVSDAYELPPVPGQAYLKPDPITMTRFTAAYVSGLPVGGRRGRRDQVGPAPTILPFTTARVQPVERPETAPEAPGPRPSCDGRSLLDVAVARMVGLGPRAHQIWVPPLDTPGTLDALMDDLSETSELGLVSPGWRRMGRLAFPIGTVDRPREQRRETLSIDLAGASGHVAVVGGPRSGKSTLLRTVLTSMALTSTPLESQFFVLDFGGGALAALGTLTHVSGVATHSQPDVVRRVLGEVSGIVDLREAYFREQGIDSIEGYRSLRATGRADDGYGDVFLVVDGWSMLRSHFPDLELEVQHIAVRGLAYGLHIVTATGRWADFRAAMRDVLGTRLELRLGDPVDSEIDRRAAMLVPPGRSGRGLVPGGLHFLGALPRIDGDPDASTLRDGVDDLVRRVNAAWRGPPGPTLRLLPARVPLDAVRAEARERALDDRLLLLGVDENGLLPVALDMDAEPHLLVYGDSGSGKSTLLRVLVREVTRTRTPQQAQLVVVDYRRSLLGELPEEYLLHYLTDPPRTGSTLRDLAAFLASRVPGPDVTSHQLRNRSWWHGAEVFVLVDDYDLVATPQSSPLSVLQPLMAQARDVGLHLIVARRSGGASRASHESVLQSMRDLAMPGLLLAGSPEEGPLLGQLRPQPAPAGRGRLLTRSRGVEVLQTAWTDASP